MRHHGRMTPRPPVSTPPLFTVREAMDHGMSRGQLRNASFARPFRGVRVAPGVVVDFVLRCAALAARTPSGHVLSHTTAARLYGIPLPSVLEAGSLHVTAPSPARGSKAAGTVGHRSFLAEDDVTSLNGIPVTTVERTWCDLAPMLTLPDLVAAGDYLLRRTAPATTRELLEEASGRRPSRRGQSRRLEALDLLSAYSESRPESHLRVALVLSPLPDPIPNFAVHLEGARRKHPPGSCLSRLPGGTGIPRRPSPQRSLAVEERRRSRKRRRRRRVEHDLLHRR